MTFMPPQANAFFMRSEDPALRARAREVMQADKRFTRIWEPAPGWIAGIDPLPDSPPDPPELDRHGLVFMEGLDVVTEGRQARLNDRLDEIAELVRNAPDRLDELPGDFSFAWFDKDGRNAAFVRSCGGLVPVYWYKTDDRFAVSTRLGDIVRYARAAPELDPLTCAIWARGFSIFPDCRSPITHILVLSRGRALKFTIDRVQINEYWNPRPSKLDSPTRQRFEEHARQLRETLVSYLDRHLHPDGGNLLTLSGGVDSSSLAAIAVRSVNRDIWTWSLLPPRGEELDQELSYIEPLLNQLHIRRHWRMHLGEHIRFSLLRQAPHACFPIIHPALCDLPRVCREASVKVLFGGEFADEICGSSFTFPDWARHTNVVQLLFSLNSLPNGFRDVFRYVKRRWELIRKDPPIPFPLELSSFVTARLQSEYRDWFHRQLNKANATDLPLEYFHQRMQFDGFVAMNWEATTTFGVRRALPFFNRDSLTLGYRCHPRELIGPGTKRLLRFALADIVPPKNLWRADKGHWNLGYDQRNISRSSFRSPDLPRIVREDWGKNDKTVNFEYFGVEMLKRLFDTSRQFFDLEKELNRVKDDVLTFRSHISESEFTDRVIMKNPMCSQSLEEM